MRNTNSPQEALLTSQGPLFVKRCDCGSIQIALGAVSLKLAPEAADYLCEALGRTLEGAPVVKRPFPSRPFVC